MENNKQSSVDWLFHKLWDEPKDKFTWYAILKEAKEMHKEEIAKSYFEGENRKWNSVNGYEYYNETFGGNNHQKNI